MSTNIQYIIFSHREILPNYTLMILIKLGWLILKLPFKMMISVTVVSHDNHGYKPFQLKYFYTIFFSFNLCLVLRKY